MERRKDSPGFYPVHFIDFSRNRFRRLSANEVLLIFSLFIIVQFEFLAYIDRIFLLFWIEIAAGSLRPLSDEGKAVFSAMPFDFALQKTN